MTTYAALLRGVNVGGHRPVPSAVLREVVSGLGHSRVSTLLASGNAVFDAEPGEGLRPDLEAALLDRLGFAVDVLLRTGEQLSAVVERVPFPTDAPKRLHVSFLSAAPTRQQLNGVKAERYLPDRLHVDGDTAYLLFAGGSQASKLGTLQLAPLATSRNWRTVLALAERTRPAG